ncbi:MAG: B-box zinc finger protein, partial [Thermomicrobiales bacterium]
PDCAGTRSSVAANPARTLTAAGAGLAVAAAVGVLWGFFPEWQFYLALLLGFGAVETMARFLTKQRGVDLQAIAIVVVIFGLVLSRVVLAQRLGVDLGEVNDLRPAVQRALYLRPIPDLIFAVLPMLISWVRFR